MPRGTSPHILNTSANLLGFCLFVITSIHVASKVETKNIDIVTSIIALILTFSCIFSFASMKIKSQETGEFLENIADYIFFFALLGILFVILLIIFNYIK